MTGAEAGAWIGLDLGTSGLKGAALGASGQVLAQASAAYPTRRPEPGAAEQDPPDWMAAAEAVARQLGRAADPRHWRAIGLSAMIPTLVTADADGQPVGSAITWQDSRADPQGDQLRERCGADDLYQATGQWVDGRYLLPMWLRIAGREPARAAATTRLLAAKDYLFGWLTGEIATDPSTAAGFGCYQLSGGWNGEALAAAADLAGRALPALPAVLPSTACAPLRAAAAARLGCGQIPVCLGAADSVLGALGLGVRRPGQVAYIGGTSTVILAVAGQLVLDPRHRFLVTPLAEPGCWGLEMDVLATGSAISWLAALLGTDEAAITALAAAADPQDAPLVLPYLGPGEQGALWDPLLRGTVVGLDLGHGRRHLARGLVNGILLESRRCLAVLQESGQSGRELRVTGGSAAGAAFRQELADAARCRVSLGARDDAHCSARGAALLALRAADGRWPSWAGAAEAETGTETAAGPATIPGPVAVPDPVRAEAWDRIWSAYDQARRAITGHYHLPAAVTDHQS